MVKNLPSGTKYGSENEAKLFVKTSKIKTAVYHGSQHFAEIITNGFYPSIDEVNVHPGISFAYNKEYAQDYAGDTGKVLKVFLLLLNPIPFDSIKVTRYMKSGWHDISEYYRIAEALGYDAVTGKGEVRIFLPQQIFIVKEERSPFIEPGTISKSERRDWQRKRNIKIKTGTGAKW